MIDRWVILAGCDQRLQPAGQCCQRPAAVRLLSGGGHDGGSGGRDAGGVRHRHSGGGDRGAGGGNRDPVWFRLRRRRRGRSRQCRPGLCRHRRHGRCRGGRGDRALVTAPPCGGGPGAGGGGPAGRARPPAPPRAGPPRSGAGTAGRDLPPLRRPDPRQPPHRDLLHLPRPRRRGRPPGGSGRGRPVRRRRLLADPGRAHRRFRARQPDRPAQRRPVRRHMAQRRLPPRSR